MMITLAGIYLIIGLIFACKVYGRARDWDFHFLQAAGLFTLMVLFWFPIMVAAFVMAVGERYVD